MARGRKAAAVEAGPVDGLWRLPDGWTWERLDTVAPVNPRRAIDLPDDAEVAFVPMAAVQELSGNIDVSARRPMGAVRTGYTKFATGDVLFAKITPCMENGKSAIVPDIPYGYGAGSTEFHVLQPTGVLPALLYYWLSQQWFRDEAEANMTGTAGQKRVSTNYLRHQPIPVPPLDTQRQLVARIEELLAELGDGEGALARAKVDLETYRKSLLKAAVTGELTADWRSANPPQETGEQLLERILADRKACWQAEPKNRGKRYKEPIVAWGEDLSMLPEGWTWASLDQLSWASAYGTSNKCSYNAEGEPVVRIPNLQEGRVDVTDLKFSVDPLELRDDDYLAPGDLLVVRTNGSRDLIGRAGIVEQAFSKPTHFASYLIRFRVVSQRNLYQWIRLFTGSALFRSRVLTSIGSSAGQYNLSMSKLAQFPVAIPPGDERGRVLNAVSEGELSLDDDCWPVARLRQSILSAAFRGELIQ